MNNGEDWSAETYSQAEEKIGYDFRDKTLLRICFTHKSYSNAYGGTNNERLEFLGDSVLQLFVTEELYRHNLADEGKLTALRKQYVSEDALNAAAERAGLMRFLRISGKAENVGKKTPSNLFEAVTAGIYLDGGMSAARAFLSRFLVRSETEDYAGILQQFVQVREKKLPQYTEREEDGGFRFTVSAMGRTAEGFGENKQAARRNAAKA
ncbi:MAG: ribonuclease III family protein, partial [Candidatus Gallimonas sp.]